MHESVVQDAVGAAAYWRNVTDKEEKVPTLFKLEMKQEMDFFRMDRSQYSPYFEKESEVLIQDATKFRISEIRQINYKDVKIAEVTLVQQ